MEHEFQMEDKPKNRKWYVWLFVAILCAMLLANMAGETFKNMFYALLSGITPILIGLIIAFLLIKPVNYIENNLLKNAFVGNTHAKGYKRAISLTICYTVIIGLVLLLIGLIIPNLINLVQLFTNDGDTYINRIQAGITDFISHLPWFSEEQAQDVINSTVTNIVNLIQDNLPAFLSSMLTFLMDTAKIILNIVMGLVLSFLLVKDKELIAKTFKRYTFAYNDRKKADEILTITRRSNTMLNQFVATTMIVSFIVFIVAWIGYEIIGVPYASLMALLLGLFSIIPYVGGFVAAIPLILVMLVFSSIDLLIIALIFCILDWALITTFVPPFIISKRINVRAIIVMMSLIIGGALFGVIGMLLSGPVAAIILIITQERIEVREAQRERDEIIATGVVNVNEVGTSDILDLREDAETSLFTPKEEMEFRFKKKKKSIEDKADDLVAIEKPAKKPAKVKKSKTTNLKKVKTKKSKNKESNEPDIKIEATVEENKENK